MPPTPTPASSSTEPQDFSRRHFIQYAAISLSAPAWGAVLGGCSSTPDAPARYPIDTTVVKTTERMVSFAYTPPRQPAHAGVMPAPADPPLSPNGSAALTWNQLDQTTEYEQRGYGQWQYVPQGLPVMVRTDLMPPGYDPATAAPQQQLLHFFAMTDVHITDKEAPNQFMHLQKSNAGFSGQNSSIYSGVMPYTHQVFDAAIQTANALHQQKPFDFFISLGDVCNSAAYNELRWYLDIIDGKLIAPSSGAHLGADQVDYQRPFQAAGLDKSIPFYQVLGNHDHFLIGSFPISADPKLDFRASYVSDRIWALPNEILQPQVSTFPALFNKYNLINPSLTKYYQGVIDGHSPHGAITGAGALATAPQVAPDPNRRALLRSEWIAEFFQTTSSPKGHGFHLVTSNPHFHLVPEHDRAGFACYSFIPKAHVPLKIIVLDDTQREDDGSVDIHGHGFLDAPRWAWLQAELAEGQAKNQLMVIAAHIPIAVSPIGSEMEWWLGDASSSTRNACTLQELVQVLQTNGNVLMWIAGHRHFNTIKAFTAPDPVAAPHHGFWQVETSSLRDFPQQLRTFNIVLHSDHSVSIEAVNVDIAVAAGTPAEKSRRCAIAAQQILHNNLTLNAPNYRTQYGKDLGPTDPSRPQGGDPAVAHSGDAFTDPSIQFADLRAQGVPYHASCNARLFKALSPQMVQALKAQGL